jgi:hypothetical protein
MSRIGRQLDAKWSCSDEEMITKDLIGNMFKNTNMMKL